MKTIKVKSWSEVPKNFTGKAEFANGDIAYRLNGKLHRLDGPARIWFNSYKEYWINGEFICTSQYKNNEQYFYDSKEYKKATLLENMKRIKDIKDQ